MSKERLKINKEIEIVPGNRHHSLVYSFPTPDLPEVYRGRVESVREGGFYGQALVLDSLAARHGDYVIKTTEPKNATVRGGRMINWNLAPFPPQYLESAAQLDHLSTRIINRVMPEVTKGFVTSPDSYGYADMGNLGYAQVLERMHGRGAKFNTNEKENAKLRKYRKLIWNLGVDMGIESAAQVHWEDRKLNNPFGKPNIWLAEDGGAIWLDTLPAIQHKEWVWPYYWPLTNVFHFPFHRNVREKFDTEGPTFNRLHSDKFRAYLNENPISRPVREELEYYLRTYDRVWKTYQGQIVRDTKDLIIEDALKRGQITKSRAASLKKSNIEYGIFFTKRFIEPLYSALAGSIKDTIPARLISDNDFQADIMKFFRDPGFRRKRIFENTVLKGMEEAYLLDLVSKKELDEAWDMVSHPMATPTESRKLMTTYIFLQSYYVVTGQLINAVSIPTILSFPLAENPSARLATGLFIDIVVPPVVRAASTAMVAAATNQNLNTAIKVSAIPKAGGNLAIPADLAKRLGNRSEKIWHYTKRLIVASLSKTLRKWGGWNTDHEAELWDKLRAEKW